MKKIFIFTIMIFSIFIGKINVSAASCNDVQCITCSYTIGPYEVTYDVTSNGGGGASFNRLAKKIDEASRIVYIFKDEENAIVSDNFIQNGEKLYCPSTLYLKYDAGASANVGVSLSFRKFPDSAAKAELNTANSSDNGKPFINSQITTGKSCAYQGTMIQGSGTVPVTITREGNEIKFEMSNGYKVGRNEIPASDFPETQDGICPTIYIKCGSNGNDKFCYFYKEATNIDNIQGNTGQEGKKPGSPDYDGDISFKTDNNLKCDTIFNTEFGEFLKKAFNLIKFAVPIIIIGMSIVDFVKAVAAQDQNEIKKAASKFVKRLIIGVIIFVLPTILEFILNIAGIEYGVCDIGQS